MTDILSSALEYHKMGFSIIPIERGGKRPLVAWEEFQKRRMSEDEVRKHFSGDVNIGIVCGAISGNLVVVDWDDKEIFENAERNFGNKEETLTTTTGKGVHKYFRLNAHCPCFRLAELSIDVKGEGGYVVAPPSLHKSGKRYERVSKATEPRLLSDTDDFKRDFITALEAALKVSLDRRKDLVHIGQILEGVAEGARDVSAIQLATWYRMRGMDQDAVRTVMLAWDSKNRPPLGDRTIREKIQSAFRPEKPYSYRFDEPPDRPDSTWLAQMRGICEDKDGNKSGRLVEILKNWILSRQDMIFATFRDTEEIFYYEKGVYRKYGDRLIKEWIEKRMDEAGCGAWVRTRLVSEVLEAVKRSTYTNREQFDERPDLLCMENGILNIWTLEFFEHTPDYRFLSKLPVTYDPKQESPVFDRFMESVIPEPKDRDALIEFMGYCLYRALPFHKSFILVGKGANGKSTFLSMLKELLGPENTSCVSLQEIESGDYSLSAIYGKLANIYPDLSAKAMTTTGRFKAMTGGDTLTTNVKYKDYMTASYTAKMIFSCNEIPKSANDDTDAYFRRWRVILFPVSFTVDKADPDLKGKLTTPEELSGVFNKTLIGLKRLLDQKRFSNDQGVENEREKYIRMSDPIRAFVLDEIESDNGTYEPNVTGEVPKNEFYRHYVDYCKTNKYLPKTEDGFFKIIKAHTTVQSVRKRRPTGSEWYVQGIAKKNVPTPDNGASERNEAEYDNLGRYES